jgi:dolichol kinase
MNICSQTWPLASELYTYLERELESKNEVKDGNVSFSPFLLFLFTRSVPKFRILTSI